MLREVKIWLDQLERDILHAQGSEESLTDKYQVNKTMIFRLFLLLLRFRYANDLCSDWLHPLHLK